MNYESINDHESTLDYYYNEINKANTTPISKEEERELILRIKKGDKKALDKLVKSNLKFVLQIANQYKGNRIPLSDLISDGNEGLVKAAMNFNPDNDIKFFSYAVYWIREAIISNLDNNGRTIRIPITLRKKIKSKREKVNENILKGEYDRSFYNDESFIEHNSHEYNSTCDIEHELSEDEEEFDTFYDKTKPILAQLLECLDERERDIIEKFYGYNGQDEMTFVQIKEYYNITSERIRQIKHKAVKKLRAKLIEKDVI